jgi:hypothetical protein
MSAPHTRPSPVDEPHTAPDAVVRALLALGLLLTVAAAYVLSAPGRIDIIDGQYRYEVARNLVLEGRPVLKDPEIRGGGARAPDGTYYAFYGAPASMLGAPLVWIGLSLGAHDDEELARSLFSFVSALLGAGAVAILLVCFLDLGLSPPAAIASSAVFGFATLAWPVATSSFDQSQHAFFALLSVWLCGRASTTGRILPGVGGGVAAGVLFLYQEAYLVVIPFLALAILDGARRPGRAELQRVAAFVAGVVPGVLASLAYNAWRFGSVLRTGKGEVDLVPTFGNPIVGFVSLVASPGKSIVLFAPPVLLAAFGFAELHRRRPWLARAVGGASAAHVLLVSSLAFFGGDWAWGPRYVVPLLGLWALAAPYGARRLGRRATTALILAGLVVQLLALSLDHQRFFFERNLHPWFWAYDRWVYFKPDRSQLLARPAELAAALREGVPETAVRFAPGPHANATTYALFGPDRFKRAASDRWMRGYRLFYLPRPWPLWMRHEPAGRPFSPGRPVVALSAAAALGLVLIAAGIHRDRRSRVCTGRA